jgi:hypothetical protein
MLAELDPYRITFFVLQYFFIVISPVLFSAAIYTILSTLVQRLPHGRTYSLLSPRALIALFVACDIVATIVQVVGAALVGVRESRAQNPVPPNDAVIAGLAFQVCTFAAFLTLTAHFLFRARAVLFQPRRSQKRSSEHVETAAGGGVSKSFVAAFVVATLAVYLRTCFRTADAAQAGYGTRATREHEAEFGALEFAPIVVCVVLFNFWHPGRCLRAAE